MDYKFRNKNGITLIVLVITIIILLILAGVSITLLTGENSIISRATKAKQEIESSNELEQIQLAAISSITNNNGVVTVRELEKELNLEENSLLNSNSWQYKGKYNTYLINKNGKVGITTNTTLNLEKFQTFAITNNPTSIIFSNKKCIDNSTDIGEDLGEIYAWMEDTTMYILSKEGNKYIQLPKNCTKFLYAADKDEYSALKTVDCSYLDSSQTTNMSYMFSNLPELTSIYFGNFNTSNVNTMSNMFRSSNKISSLDLLCFDTSKVTGMGCMFYFCTSLTDINLSSFDTHQVKDMTRMFSFCSNLQELNVSQFDTSKVINMSYMFGGCRNIQRLDLTNFNTFQVNNMSYMFYECAMLEEMDLSSFDTSKVTNMEQMFSACNRIKNIFVSDKWSVENVSLSNNMFWNCYNLKNWNSSGIDKTNANSKDNGYLSLKQ